MTYPYEKSEGPRWLPESLYGGREDAGAALCRLMRERFPDEDWGVDLMTDQIDIYRKGRVYARYMV